MERYYESFSADVGKWVDTIKPVGNLPFECTQILGRGESCSVYAIAAFEDGSDDSDDDASDASAYTETEEKDWTDTYFGLDDVKGSSDDESEESSGEWVNGDSDDCSKPDVNITITSPSPMGVVEVVAKKFSHLDDDVCYHAYDPTTRAILFMEEDPHKFIKWLAARTEHTESRVLTERITPSMAYYGGFVAESLCHLLLTDIVARNIVPHITMAFRALECHNSGYLIQERVTCTLEEVLEKHPGLGAPEIAALYLQVAFTMHVLQDTCRLKHHDLHTDNVFIKAIDDTVTWKGEKLADATHFSYDLGDGTVLYTPNTGFIVKIGDFGMSSLDVAGRRLQRFSVDVLTTDAVWGEWSNKLEGHEGYDLQMFMGQPPFEDDSWRMGDKPTLTFLRHMRTLAQGPDGCITRGQLRPMIGHVSRVTPMEVLRGVFVDAPGAGYDFRAPPVDETARVVCLGNVGDLSTVPPMVATKKRKRRGSAAKK